SWSSDVCSSDLANQFDDEPGQENDQDDQDGKLPWVVPRLFTIEDRESGLGNDGCHQAEEWESGGLHIGFVYADSAQHAPGHAAEDECQDCSYDSTDEQNNPKLQRFGEEA